MKTLHENLLKIKQLHSTRKIDSPLGICHFLEELDDPLYCSDELWKLLKSWPEFSGSNCFPVPHPTMSPGLAFQVFGIDSMWYEGEYAAARVRLLDFLIEATK